MTDATEPGTAEKDRKPGEPSIPAKITFWLLAVATLAAIAAVIVRLRPDPGLWISLLVVWLVFWLALWLVAFVSKEPSAKDIGVALLTGLVLAGAAFVLNFVLEEALASRDRERREAETKLAINRRDQFVFRGEDFREFDLQGMALVSSGGERFDLSFADLTDADLSQAELRRVLLRNAVLIGANLRAADLADANMRDADLTGADFTEANLSGADLTGAAGFDETGAVLSENTVCDTGTEAAFSGDRFTCEAGAGDEPEEGHPVFLVSRNSVPGSVVGRVAATDPDADVLTYAVVGDGDPRFNVDARTGVITVAAALDVATDAPRVELDVAVSDGESEQIQTVVIVVETDNAAPLAVVSYLVHESSEVGSRVGRIEPPPGWDAIEEYEIEAGDSSGIFEFDEERPGVLKLAGRPPPGTSYVLNVAIKDGQKGTTRLPVQVTVIGDNSPPAVLTADPLEVAAGAAPGTTVGVVDVEDADGDSVTFSLAEAGEAPAFAIDPVSGAVVVGEAAAGVGDHVLSVVVTDTGIPPRSVQAEVTVRVRPPLTAAVARRYLTADGGTLVVARDDGLLSEEQRAAGVGAELTEPPAHGTLRDPGAAFRDSGTFTYIHPAGSGPDAFSYQTVDTAGTASDPAEVTIGVVTAETAPVDSASPAGTVAARLAVEGVAPASVTFGPDAAPAAPFAIDAVGTIVTTVAGAQLFADSPWHDVAVFVTDQETGRTQPLVVGVEIRYVVEPGDALNAIAARVLAAAAAQGRPCDETTGQYAAAVAEASDVGGLDPGEVLVIPDCRTAG